MAVDNEFGLGKCSVPGSEVIWNLQIRINMELQSDLEAGVQCFQSEAPLDRQAR